MKYIKIQKGLLNKIRDDGDISLFSKWLSLKYLTKNSILYKYNPNKATTLYNKRFKTNLSPKTMNSNIIIFIEKGWCYFTPKGHLRFHRQYYLSSELYNTENLGAEIIKLNTSRESNYKNIKLKLFSILLNFEYKKQQLILSVHAESYNGKSGSNIELLGTSKKVVKKAINKFSKANIEKRIDEIDTKFNISYEGLAKLFNCSKTTSFSIIKQLISKGLVKKKRRVEKVCKGFGNANANSLNELGGKGYFFNGAFGVFVIYTNQYLCM